MRKMVALILVVFLWVPVSSRASDIAATAATFSVQGGATRFVLEVTGEPERRIFAVDGPPRLVLDLERIDFDLRRRPEGAGLVREWRFGALTPASGRIVFDLATPALVARQFFLPALAGRSARLVVDLVPTDEATFERIARSATASPVEAVPVASAPAADERTVVLDPGHGGIDPGAVTQDGLEEKGVTLAFAERLRERIEALPDVAVRLTRTDDRFLSLNQRIRIARAYEADLFISIHADAAPQDWVRGATVYTLSERPSDAQAAALAARENLADTVSGAIEPDLQEEVSGILADLMRKETKTYSFAFAESLVERMSEAVRMNSNPHRYARFRVLMAHDVPSVLLELGYLTNAEDTQSLLTPAWQERASAAVAAAVSDFFAEQRARASDDRDSMGLSTVVR
jgi:N-acetylmuramoyl-L-alanine amidase